MAPGDSRETLPERTDYSPVLDAPKKYVLCVGRSGQCFACHGSGNDHEGPCYACGGRGTAMYFRLRREGA